MCNKTISFHIALNGALARRAVVGCCLFVVLATMLSVGAYAQPVSGDVYREYLYTNTYGDAGGAIRVGGKKGVSYADRGSDFGYVNAWIDFPHEVDLEHAVRAEVVIEKILSHNGTKGLAIQWNESDWNEVPEPTAIPEPRRNYYHHTCVSVPLALEEILEANRFRLRVHPEQDWGWPQHLIYGVHLRVYYAPDMKTHNTATIAAKTVENGHAIQLEMHPERLIRRIEKVDYLPTCTATNWAGDGRYHRRQEFYYHGRLLHHAGSSVVEPFSLRWDVSWLPDQTKPIEIVARLVDDTNLITLTQATTVELKRSGWSVELCKPQATPENWVTRQKEYEQPVEMTGDPARAVSARLEWSSWSPGYMNGVFVNGSQVIQSEGPRYRYYDHRVAIGDLSVLRKGSNIISTGKTPLYDGKMVHGMEVNWPGIQMLVRYQDDAND